MQPAAGPFDELRKHAVAAGGLNQFDFQLSPSARARQREPAAVGGKRSAGDLTEFDAQSLIEPSGGSVEIAHHVGDFRETASQAVCRHVACLNRVELPLECL